MIDPALRHREPANELCPYCWRRYHDAAAVEQHIASKHGRIAYPETDETRMRRLHERRLRERSTTRAP